ncbi:MAG TPA: RNB domain-containing ribonuclease [Vicinamibacteria bacterium]|nr:RNB domain-containing ribonuclease [Vicinamibacteria bacterium]
MLWASLDNTIPVDLDQLIAKMQAKDVMTILVAVADVDAAVKKGSATDGHARTSTTSVYTAAALFPILPERLSTDLTSLGESQERFALVIEMAVGAYGAGDGVRRLSRK